MTTPTPIAVEAVHCLNCDDVIWSESRHDFKYCECGECFVDGGRDYFRAGFTTRDTVVFGRLVLATREFVVEADDDSTPDDGTASAVD